MDNISNKKLPPFNIRGILLTPKIFDKKRTSSNAPPDICQDICIWIFEVDLERGINNYDILTKRFAYYNPLSKVEPWL